MPRWTLVALPSALRELVWSPTRRLLVIALALSLLFHMLATVGTSGWLNVWQEPRKRQFDAYLAPATTLESDRVAANLAPATAPAALKAPRRRVTTPRITARSNANFSPPENAIAVDGSSEQDRQGGTTTVEPESKLGEADVPRQAPDAKTVINEPTPQTTSPTTPLAELPAPIADAASVADLPSRVSISYNATTSIADGVAHYKWKREGANYTFESTIQASGFFVNMFAGTITQESTGALTTGGIAPRRFSIRRGDKPPETAEFDSPKGKVRLSRESETRELDMPPKLQDTQSFLFQLAVEAPKLRNLDDRIEIWVTNARGLNRYIFKKVGESTIETRLGNVETIHLIRETAEVRDTYEAWLSPSHHYLPVKLKFYLDRFPAELIATTLTSTP